MKTNTKLFAALAAVVTLSACDQRQPDSEAPLATAPVTAATAPAPASASAPVAAPVVAANRPLQAPMVGQSAPQSNMVLDDSMVCNALNLGSGPAIVWLNGQTNDGQRVNLTATCMPSFGTRAPAQICQKLAQIGQPVQSFTFQNRTFNC